MSELPRLPDLVVLLAEPSPFMRRIQADVLTRCGIKRIIEASDGAEALTRMKTAFPDLIIMEWDMPVLSGEDLVRLMREGTDVSRRETPVIVTLAMPTQRAVTTAIQLGIHELLVKPFSPKALCEKVGSGLVRSRDAQRRRLKTLRTRDDSTMPIAAAAKTALR